MPDVPAAADHLRPIRFRAVTVGLIMVNVAVFLVLTTLTQRQLSGVWLGFGMIPALLDGSASLAPGIPHVAAWLTLVTALFLHAGFWHIGGNMLFLWLFGGTVEDAMGPARFLVLYLAGGVVGNLAEALATPGSQVPVIGASGAIAAALGAYLMLHPYRRMVILLPRTVPLRLHVGLVLIVWIAFQIGGAVLIGTGPDDTIAWWTHIGGFLVGMALIVPLRRPGVPLFDRSIYEEVDEEWEVRD